MVYQALARGRPVLGLPANHDQFYVMEALERKGAGRVLRADCVCEETLRPVVEDMLGDASYARAAQKLQSCISALDTPRAFTSNLNDLLSPAVASEAPDTALLKRPSGSAALTCGKALPFREAY